MRLDTGPNPSNRAIYLTAFEIADDHERQVYLENACAGDDERRRKIERLLAARPASAVNLVDRAVEQLGPGETMEGEPRTTFDVDISSHPTIDRYKLLEQIGEGGMGAVFMAQQTHPVKRKVALKLIKPGMDSRQVIARFEAERQALAMMDHPNIARVLDAGATTAGHPYFVMELVRGMPITEYCDQERLSIEDRLRLFIDVCRAVQHAHHKGIIHRDLKPSNVMVTLHDGKPVVKVIDFGVAKALNDELTGHTLFTQFSQMIGTPLYMSPEQAEMSGLDIDTRSDIYSLGVLLYELLTGTTPFDRETLAQAGFEGMRRVICEQEPPRPSHRISTLAVELQSTTSSCRNIDARQLVLSMRRELDWISMKALDKDRDRRYESASSLAAEIQRYLSDETIQACPPSFTYQTKKFVRRNRALVLASAAIGASLLLGTAVSLWQAAQATFERNRADAQAERAEHEAERANREAGIAAAVNAFLNEDLLAQADPANQPDPNVKLRTVIDRAAQTVEDKFADQPEVEAAIRHTLAVSYEALGDYQSARKHIQRAVELRTQELGLHHEAAIDSAHVLAWVKKQEGDYRDSRQQLSKLLTRAEAVLGDESPLFLKISGSLSEVMMELGEYTEAERLINQTLAIQIRTLGNEHSATLTSKSRLASIYRDKGDFAAATRLHHETLETQQRTLSKHHPSTLVSLQLLALAHAESGRFSEAEDLYQQAIAAARQTLGDEHPNTLTAISNLAGAYYDMGRYEEAEQLHREILEVRRRTLGEQHPQTLGSMGNISLLYQNTGKYEEAEQLCNQVLELQRSALGEEHPDTLTSMGNLAIIFRQQQRYREAEELGRQTLEIQSRVLGEEHPEVLKRDAELATVLQKTKRHHEAGQLLERILKRQCQRLGESHPDSVRTMLLIGNNLEQQDRFTEASEIYEKAIDISRKALGEENILTIVGLHNLALMHCESRKYEESEELYCRVLELERRLLGDRHPYTAACIVGLAKVYSLHAVELYRAGEWQEVIDHLRQAADVRENGDAGHRMFVAMANWQLGNQETARDVYVKCAAWIEAHQPNKSEQQHFRQEAEQLMGITEAESENLVAQFYADIDVTNVQALIDRGQWHAIRAEHRAAIDDLSAALHLQPELNSFGLWQTRGMSYYRCKEYELAVSDLTKAVELKPSSFNARKIRGWSYQKLGQLDRALSDMSRCVQAMPDVRYHYMHRAEIYRGLGEFDLALADCQRAIVIDPQHDAPYFSRVAAHILRGDILGKNLQQFNKAAEEYAKALALDPQNAVALEKRERMSSSLSSEPAAGDEEAFLFEPVAGTGE